MNDIPYLNVSPESTESAHTAVIVLPEIFGLNDFVRSVADRAARELGVIGVGLDHFYAANGKVNTIEYNEHDKGAALMQEVTGEAYVDLLSKTIDSIMTEFPLVKNITVLGFCFGGKLAYLSGVDPRVTTIVSFYGGASLTPDFYRGKSVIEALVDSRRDDAELRILGLFGEEDDYISLQDREGIHDALDGAHISYELAVFQTGHAFFNRDRPDRYHEASAEAAWSTVIAFLQ